MPTTNLEIFHAFDLIVYRLVAYLSWDFEQEDFVDEELAYRMCLKSCFEMADLTAWTVAHCLYSHEVIEATVSQVAGFRRCLWQEAGSEAKAHVVVAKSLQCISHGGAFAARLAYYTQQHDAPV